MGPALIPVIMGATLLGGIVSSIATDNPFLMLPAIGGTALGALGLPSALGTMGAGIAGAGAASPWASMMGTAKGLGGLGGLGGVGAGGALASLAKTPVWGVGQMPVLGVGGGGATTSSLQQLLGMGGGMGGAPSALSRFGGGVGMGGMPSTLEQAAIRALNPSTLDLLKRGLFTTALPAMGTTLASSLLREKPEMPSSPKFAGRQWTSEEIAASRQRRIQRMRALRQAYV